MSRETKQERLIRGMQDQITEHLHQIKSVSSNPNCKEVDIERWCESVLRNCLGFTAINGYAIRAQEAKGKMRPDLVVMKNDKPVFVVEVKRHGFDLGKSDFRSGKLQLKEYLSNLGEVKWGMLCNGFKWKLYDFSNPAVGGIEIASLDIRGYEEVFEINKKVAEEVSWNFADFHEASFASNAWQDLSKEATAFSPESLSRAILSADVVKYLARVIRGEHEYKANLEILTDRLLWLLEQGLNDAIPGWNDSKHVELQKYIKAQKRVGRRAKRVAKPTALEPTIDESQNSISIEREEHKVAG